MNIRKDLWALATIVCCSTIALKAQSSLTTIEDSVVSAGKYASEIGSTWKDTRIINAQTTKVASPGVMVFRIMHRFGDVGTSGGGFPTLYGFDEASDIYFSFEFGVTKNLEVGLGRSMKQQLIDVFGKYKLLTQKPDGTPISMTAYEDIGVTPESSALLYADANNPSEKFSDRFCYFSQLIIDRRFSKRLSIELFGGLSHRNYVLQEENPNNSSTDQNDIPYTGAGGRFMITKHAAIVFDYFYTISQFRTNNNPSYSNALSIGYEVETGGHVFEINVSNASYINENNIVPYTTDSWTNAGFKLGFSISRAFDL